MDFPTEPTRCILCGGSDGPVVASGRDYIYRGSEQTVSAIACAQCGHVYLNPRPSADAIAVLYPANYASFSGKFTQEGSLVARLKERVMLGRVRRLLDALPAGSRFLDLGCGDGQLLEAVKRRYPGIEVHGLDWRFEAQARARLERAGIVLHESRLEEAQLEAGSFHLVTMNQLIEHLWEPGACLAMIRRILVPGGRLALTTPDIDGYDRRLFGAGLWGGYYFPRHLNLFNRKTLARLLEGAGLELEESAGLVAPVVWCYSLKAWAVARRPAAVRLHRWLDVQNAPLLALFTGLDLVALRLGARTSNQLAVARAPRGTG